MKPAFTDLAGNETLKKRLCDDILSDRLTHAYLIEGAPGTGKHALSLRIAAALACENKANQALPLPCTVCPACRKILSGNHPDVSVIGRQDKATIGVDVIREMQADTAIAPNEAENKIYVIEDAHLLTVQAQNAFLLTLEEPPSYVRFFLLCESTAPLLETIRSRVITLRTEPIDPEAMDAWLTEHNAAARALKNANPDEFRELIAASGGSIGQALALTDAKTRRSVLELREGAKEFLNLFSGNRNSGAVLSYFAAFGQKREDILQRLRQILIALRDLLVLKQSESAPLCFFATREEAISLAFRFSSPELFRLCDAIESATEDLRRNANVRLTLTRLAMQAGLLN